MVKDNPAVSTTSTSNDPTHEATQLLLRILRNVDREVKTLGELPDKAKAAIQNFGLIAADLAVPESITPRDPYAPKTRAK